MGSPPSSLGRFQFNLQPSLCMSDTSNGPSGFSGFATSICDKFIFVLFIYVLIREAKALYYFTKNMRWYMKFGTVRVYMEEFGKQK